MNAWLQPKKNSLFVAIDGLRVHYKQVGEGPVLLLLHGSGSSLQGVEQLAALLSRSFTVIYPDLPGCGLTGPRADRDYRVEAYVTLIARFMQALQIPHYAVAGNSLGGNIAWSLALDEPQRLKALVLINATGYPGKSLPAGMRLARNPLLQPLLRRWLPRWATERSLRSAVGSTSTIVDDAMVDRVHGLMSLPGNRSAFVDLANTDQKDRSAEIRRITVPTLVLRSASVDGQHFTHEIKDSREAIHAEGGHLLPEEDPVWVAQEIEAFLLTLPGGAQHDRGAP